MSRKMIFGALAGFISIAFLFALPSMSFAQEGKWSMKSTASILSIRLMPVMEPAPA